MITHTYRQILIERGKQVLNIIEFGIITKTGDENESYEEFYIRYGGRKKLELCSIYKKDSMVYLSASVGGGYGDVKLEPAQFLLILKKLKSVLLLDEWANESFNTTTTSVAA